MSEVSIFYNIASFLDNPNPLALSDHALAKISLFYKIKNTPMDKSSSNPRTKALQIFIRDSNSFLKGIGLRNTEKDYLDGKIECFDI